MGSGRGKTSEQQRIKSSKTTCNAYFGNSFLLHTVYIVELERLFSMYVPPIKIKVCATFDEAINSGKQWLNRMLWDLSWK